MATLLELGWPCIHPADQSVMVALAGASASMTPYVTQAAMVAIWLSYYGAPVATYRDAFVEWATIATGKIEGVTVWFADRPWMVELYNGRLAGGYPVSNAGCTSLQFPTYPD